MTAVEAGKAREETHEVKPSTSEYKSWSFADVFSAEYRDLHARCNDLPGGAPDRQTPTVGNGLIGVSLSGGGIRSSTFCLGALQAMNESGILKNVNYLSTVSGGGYIGTALSVGMSTNGGTFPFGKTGQDVGETPETRHLRDNSRYLVQSGARSVISALAIYLRGIVMNIIIVLPFLFAAAGVLVLLKPDTSRLDGPWSWMAQFPAMIRDSAMPLSILGLFIVAALLVAYAIGVSIVPIIPLERRRRVAFWAAVVMSAFGAVVLLETHLWVLRMVFAAQHAIAPSPASPTETHIQIGETLVETIGKIAALVTPFVVAVLPFLKSIAEKATAESTGRFSEAFARWGSRVALLLIAAAIPLLLWLTVLQLAYWGIGISDCEGTGVAACLPLFDTWQHAPSFMTRLFVYDSAVPIAQLGHGVGLSYLLAAVLLLLLWPFLNVNANSLHQLYRDRLGSAFLVRRSTTDPAAFEGADDFALSAISNSCAPYHLINAALNVPGSSFANRRGRNADFFLFSRNFVGSEATGYVPTAMAEEVNDGLNIGTAMAISGAAAAPNMGMASLRPLSATIALLNVRLGRWLRHPLDTVRDIGKPPWERWWNGKPGPIYLLREAFFKSGANVVDPTTEAPLSSGFVFLTDGGHIENLGIYELLRRRCAVIIAVDGEADAEMTASSLVRLQRFARIDLGTRIFIDWEPIAARSRAVSAEVKTRTVSPQPGPHVAIGLIDYPGAGDGPRERGVLIYIKASLSGDENDYVMAYKAAHPSFPHESTMDQLFSEEQFEAYRALGEHITLRLLTGQDMPSVAADFDRELAISSINLLFRNV
jgi:hypothetical protein